MDLHAILIRAPVNKLAASVVAQRRCAPKDLPLTRAELVYLCERVMRKQRLLKQVLGIKSLRQQKNMKHKVNHGRRPTLVKREPRAWSEFRVCGEQISKLQHEIAAINATERLARRAARAAAEAA